MTRNDASGSATQGGRPWGRTTKQEPQSKPDFDDNDDNGDDDKSNHESSWKAPSLLPWTNVTMSALPGLGMALKSFFGATVMLYILNQKHMLPRPLSAAVSKSLFWPTLPITVSRRIGKWITRVDDTVLMGGAPFGFWNIPEDLYQRYGVRGVINMCEEYQGPTKKYAELGIEQLYLPTTDHFEPEEEDLISAVAFIKRHQAHGKSVYVHCRAGHGRSAAAVFAWLMYKDPVTDLEKLNQDFCKLRNVRKSLWKQTNIQKLHQRLLQKGTLIDMDDSRGDLSPPRMIQDVSDDDEDDEDANQTDL